MLVRRKACAFCKRGTEAAAGREVKRQNRQNARARRVVAPGVHVSRKEAAQAKMNTRQAREGINAPPRSVEDMHMAAVPAFRQRTIQIRPCRRA